MPKMHLIEYNTHLWWKTLIKVGIENISQHNRASLVAQMVRICLQCRRPRFNPWIRKVPWRRESLPSITTQYSCLENSMDRGARWAAAHGLQNRWTQNTQKSLCNHSSPVGTAAGGLQEGLCPSSVSQSVCPFPAGLGDELRLPPLSCRGEVVCPLPMQPLDRALPPHPCNQIVLIPH